MTRSVKRLNPIEREYHLKRRLPTKRAVIVEHSDAFRRFQRDRS